MAQGFSVAFPQRLFDANGLPANGWKITTYAAGTSTPLTTYSNPTLTSANTNPIITSSTGFFRCYVAAAVLIKCDVTNASDVAQTDYSFDNLEPMLP